MVTKLIGKIDGLDIVFTRGQGDTWTCVFPIDGRTEAVVELSAYDDAGNYSYKTCYLLTFDPYSLYISLAPIDYWLASILEDNTLECISPQSQILVVLPEQYHLIKIKEDLGRGLVRID